MKLWVLAWKNLSRYRKRTIITVSALTVGLAFFILTDSLIKGANDDSVINLIRFETGSGEIADPAFRNSDQDFPIDKLLPSGVAFTIGEKLADAGIPYAPRIHFSGEIIHDLGSFPVKVTAIDPERDEDVFALAKRIEKGGAYFSAEGGDESLVVGSWLAADLGLKAGDTVSLFFTDSSDVAYLQVCGLLNTSNPIINREGVFITVDTAQYYLDRSGVSGLSVLLPDNPALEGRGGRSFVKRIDNLLADVEMAEFLNWRLLSSDFLAALEGDKAGSAIFLFLVFLIAAIGISNTLLMSIMERTKEIGMMRALGMDEGDVSALFLKEALLIGILGSCGGLFLGAFLNIFLVRYGLDYGAIMRDNNIGYRILGIFYGKWSFSSFVTAFFSGIGIALLVGFFSVRKPLKKSIAVSLSSR